MADKYDRLLSDYYTGLLNKKLQIFEELEISQILRLSRPDEYRDLKRTIDILDNVIAALRPIHKDILRARYGDKLPYAALSVRFNKSETALHNWKNKAKQRMREAGV